MSDRDPRATDRPLEGASLLLVGDDPSIRRAVRRLLEAEGASLVDAADGEQAIRVLEEDEARLLDAVVTDLEMPVVSGHELIAVLEECRPDLPIIAMTGYARPVVFGTVPLLLKPFSPDELVQILGPMVRRSQEMQRHTRQAPGDAAESRPLAARPLARTRQQKGSDLMATLERQRAALKGTASSADL